MPIDSIVSTMQRKNILNN